MLKNTAIGGLVVLLLSAIVWTPLIVWSAVERMPVGQGRPFAGTAAILVGISLSACLAIAVLRRYQRTHWTPPILLIALWLGAPTGTYVSQAAEDGLQRYEVLQGFAELFSFKPQVFQLRCLATGVANGLIVGSALLAGVWLVGTISRTLVLMTTMRSNKPGRDKP